MEVVTAEEWLNSECSSPSEIGNNDASSRSFYTKNKVDLKCRITQLQQEKAALEQHQIYEKKQFDIWKKGMIELLRFKDNQLNEQKEIIDEQKVKIKSQMDQLFELNQQMLKLSADIFNNTEVQQQINLLKNIKINVPEKERKQDMEYNDIDQKETEDLFVGNRG
eukprot:833153_1